MRRVLAVVRLVGGIGKGPDHNLVAAEMSIQRGYNILNSSGTAALGAVIYLTRFHPPLSDLAFPLSLVCSWPHIACSTSSGQAADVTRQLRSEARLLWFDSIGRQVHFRTIGALYRTAFVGNTLAPMSQTIVRSTRSD